MENVSTEDWMTQDEWYQTRGSKLFTTGPAGIGFRAQRGNRALVGLLVKTGCKTSWLENVIDNIAVIDAQKAYSRLDIPDPKHAISIRERSTTVALNHFLWNSAWDIYSRLDGKGSRLKKEARLASHIAGLLQISVCQLPNMCVRNFSRF